MRSWIEREKAGDVYERVWKEQREGENDGIIEKI